MRESYCLEDRMCRKFMHMLAVQQQEKGETLVTSADTASLWKDGLLVT